ncbi:Trp biosynthesis-associated membrane protein [Micromonosporaceae bacterium Da 78-11]
MACLAGAGLAIYAVTRTWSLQIVARDGLSDLRTVRTGADLEPWVIGLALVALAGTGALLATRGRARRGLGALLMLTGLGVTVGAILGRAGLDVGRAGSGATFWPIACALGGAIIILGGLTAARRGHLWPIMSARYERKPVPSPVPGPGATAEPSAAAGPKRGETSEQNPAQPADYRLTWDALDRGDDPTAV